VKRYRQKGITVMNSQEVERIVSKKNPDKAACQG
jgi:hypothetical protein